MTSGADPIYIVQCNSDVACPGGSLGSCPGNNMGIACSLLLVERTFRIFWEKDHQTVYSDMSEKLLYVFNMVMYIISFINFIIYLFVYLFTFCFSVGRLEFQSVRFTSSQQNKVWIAGRITICTQMTANAILVMVFLVSGRQFFVIFSDR